MGNDGFPKYAIIPIAECVRIVMLHSLGILSAGTLTEPARKEHRIIRCGHSISQASLVAPHLYRYYALMCLAVFLRQRHRLKPTAQGLRLTRLRHRPSLKNGQKCFCPFLPHSTEQRQKARARQVCKAHPCFFLVLCCGSRASRVGARRKTI